MNGNLLDEAIKTLQKRQGPVTPEAIPVYERLGQAMLSRTVNQEANSSDNVTNVGILRDILYRLGTQYRTQHKSIDDRLLTRIENVLMATHYQSLFHTAKSLGMKDMHAKCAVTLLKYPTVLPQDKALYQAG